MNTLPALRPLVRVWDNPLAQPEAELVPLYEYEPHLHLPLRSLLPRDCGRAVLVVNGMPLMQREWYRPVLPGDVIDWHVLPCGGGGGSRAVLQIIAAIAIAYFTAGLGYGALATAAINVGLNIAASVLINALIPLRTGPDASLNGTSPGSVYNTSLSANQARLNQPIPVIYGRMRTYMDFAAQPYTYYSNNNQYYAALFCVGQGEYVAEKLMIDDSPLDSFHDIFYNILPPGTAPTRVLGNVITAVEVAGNELKANIPIGGFVVTKAGQTITKVAWDVACDQGLGVADASGNFTPFNIVFNVDFQFVDDFGSALSDWALLKKCTVSAGSRTPQRFTFSGALPTPGRVSIRLTRVTDENTSNLVLNTLTWTGLRGYLQAAAPLASTATHIEVLMLASEQLNGITQKKFNAIVRRKLPTWAPGTGWSLPVETRLASWAIADVWRNTVYGDRLDDSGIDVQGLYDLAQIAAARQDRCDIMFDSRITSRDATHTLAQTCRAITFQRMGLFTVSRDQLASAPLALFGSRDFVPGSVDMIYALVTPETPDSINYEYFDNRAWDWLPIPVTVPGIITPINPVTVRVQGITGFHQARREALFLAAVNAYRRKFPTWQTEMKGLLPAYGSAVQFHPAMPGWGQSGDVVGWDVGTKVVRGSEPFVFTPGANHFITFEQSNGAPTAAFPCTPGSSPLEVQLTSLIPFTPIINDSDRERTKYIFGKQGEHQIMVRLMNVRSKGRSEAGNPIIELASVAENNLVHSADNAELPAPGVIQDPVPTTVAGLTSTSEFDDGLNTNPIVSLIGHSLRTGSGPTGGDLSILGGAITISIKHDGTTQYKLFHDTPAYVTNLPTLVGSWANEWLSGPPDVGYTANFEVKVTFSPGGGGGATVGDVSGTWTNLGAGDRTWTFFLDTTNLYHLTVLGGEGAEINQDATRAIGLFNVQIRKVGTGTPLSNVTFKLEVLAVDEADADSITGGGDAGDSADAAVGVGDDGDADAGDSGGVGDGGDGG